MQWLMIAGGGLLLGICFIFILRKTLKRASLRDEDLLKEEEGEKLTFTTLKIGYNFFQIMSFLAAYGADWGSSVRTMLTLLGVTSSMGEAMDLGQMDCMIELDVFDRYLLSLIAPIALILLVCVILVLFRVKSVQGHSPFQLLKCVAVIILYLIHPAAMKQTFEILQCKDVDGSSVMSWYPYISCSSSKYLIFRLLGWLILVGYGIGFPMFVLVVLRCKKDELSLRTVRKSLGMTYLYYGYRDEVRWCWEMVILGRKLGIMSIGVFLSSQPPGVQLLTGAIVLIMSSLLQIRYQPFTRGTQNTLEFVSVIVALMSMLLGAFLQYDTIPDLWKGIIRICIISSTAAITLLYVMTIVRESMPSCSGGGLKSMKNRSKPTSDSLDNFEMNSRTEKNKKSDSGFTDNGIEFQMGNQYSQIDNYD